MKRQHKIATLRRLVALTMLSALLVSNTAVYADTGSEGEPSQQEVVNETGNTNSLSSTTSSDSSNNLKATVSGTQISNDNTDKDVADVTDEATEEAKEQSDAFTFVTLNVGSAKDADKENDEDDEEGFDLASALGEAKHLGGGLFGGMPSEEPEECTHETLNYYAQPCYQPLDNGKHAIYYPCATCGEYQNSGNTEDCDYACEKRYEQVEGQAKHVEVQICKCGAEKKLEAQDCDFTYCTDYEWEEANQHIEVQHCVCGAVNKLAPVKCESANPHVQGDGDKHHQVSGRCDICKKHFSYSEKCTLDENGAALQYCEKDGCLNIIDKRKTKPQITVKTTVKDGSSSDSEEITEGDKTYTAYDKQIQMEVTVKTEALNDESKEDMEKYLNAYLYLDGEGEQSPVRLDLYSFENGKAVFTWESKKEYNEPVYVKYVEVGYSLGTKLKNGSRGTARTDCAKENLDYYLRNVNTDKQVKKIKGTVTGGKGWKLEGDNKWYSKSLHNNEDLTITFTGKTDAKIDTSSVKLEEINANGATVNATGIKPIKVTSERHFELLDGWKLSFKFVYENTIQYQVPAEDDGVDGVEHIYKTSFTMLGKEHHKTISTFVDNHAPEVKDVVYTSEADRLNGKYYKANVEASVEVSDVNLSSCSFIKAEGLQTNLPSGAENPYTLRIRTCQDGDYTVSGEIYDLAGNCTKIEGEKEFTVDTKAPEVKTPVYTSKADRLNGKYYNKDVKTSVKFDDLHLSPESFIEVSGDKAVDEKTDGSLEITVKKQGVHKLTGVIYDLAGNCTKIEKEAEFVIDKTAPEVGTVVYTSEADRLHGKYYNKDVTASVEIKDKYLNPTSFIAAANEKTNASEDVTTSEKLSLTVKDEGVHTLTGEIYDLAGNCTKIESEKEFIIDKTAPKVEAPVYTSKADRLNGKYYNKDVEVSVKVEDLYLDSDKEKTLIEVSGLKSYLPEKVQKNEEIKLLVEPEGEHLLTGIIYDLAGNYTKIDNEAEFVIDKTAPEIKLEFDNNSAKSGKYYNASRTASITILEKNFSEKGIKVDKTDGKLYDVPSLQAFTKSELKNMTKILFDKDGHYGFTVNYTDLAGNEAKTFVVDDFVIDTVAPQITIKFDNHDFKHDKYYKANRTATFVLKDTEVFENLSSTEADINKGVTVAKKFGTPKFNAMSGSSSNYSGTIVFDEDGEYQITNVDFYDKAGNKAVITSESDANYSAEFVVDKTAPVVDVDFDNKSALNGNYFKAARRAEIVFTEKNFTADQVTINKNSGEQNQVPNVQGYTQNDLKNITHIDFDKDGRYGFTVSCEDLAGNMSNSFVTEDFVIDLTLPELEISGVEDMSANNGKVAPVIVSKDTNLTDACTEISLVGSNRGKVTPTISKSNGTETFTYSLADMAHEKANDDLYTLSVKLTDLAGNSVEKTVKFSLNRFGSVFVLSEETKAMVNNYYVTTPHDVVITEINVDSLTKKEVSVAYDGSVRDLREGASFTVNDSTNSNGWHSISYNVGRANFNKDGIYAVTVFSEDKASNKQSNQSKDAEVEFLLDKTAPSVIVSGLEDGGIYEEDSHDFSVNAADTIGVTDMKVYLNDEKLASYTAEELNENGGTAVLTIPSKDDYQKVTIQCTDVAGNVTNLAYNNLLVSVKAEELLLEDNLNPTAKLDVDKNAVASAVKNMPTGGIVAILGAIAAICGAGALVATKKKRK